MLGSFKQSRLNRSTCSVCGGRVVGEDGKILSRVFKKRSGTVGGDTIVEIAGGDLEDDKVKKKKQINISMINYLYFC